ncbi:MAG: PTS sugar transporter subunit IIC [Atopobiaceae bacterium]|nr:PTS sugar transporter subunit IIC [Atopobiaceae bacterium]
MSEETTAQPTFMDKVMDVVMKIAAPLGRFGMLKPIASIQDGMLATIPLTIAGAIFLVIYVLGSPSIGDSGKALLPFLEPLSDKFVWMNSVTLALLSLYASMTIASAYGRRLGVDNTTCGLLGMAAFIVVTSGPENGIDVANFSANGLFVAMVVSLLATKVYSWFILNGFTIKMPEMVPPQIGNSFAAIVPYAAVLGVCWIIRTLLNIDLIAILMGVLAPLAAGADNIFVYLGARLLANLMWVVGLHGDNMLLSNFQPFGLMWLEENAAALAAGTPSNMLPHVLAGFGTGGGIDRLVMWPSAIWPLVIFMIRSKVKTHNVLGWTALAPALFTITEPVVFGLPLVLNPYLCVPFLLNTIVGPGVCFMLDSTPMFGKFFANMPWATPPFLLGPLATGDIKTALLPLIAFAIGFVIYLPFWRAFEAHALAEEQGEVEAA